MSNKRLRIGVLVGAVEGNFAVIALKLSVGIQFLSTVDVFSVQTKKVRTWNYWFASFAFFPFKSKVNGTFVSCLTMFTVSGRWLTHLKFRLPSAQSQCPSVRGLTHWNNCNRCLFQWTRVNMEKKKITSDHGIFLLEPFLCLSLVRIDQSHDIEGNLCWRSRLGRVEVNEPLMNSYSVLFGGDFRKEKCPFPSS